MHYILDYRAEEKYKANEELVNNGHKNEFIKSIIVSAEELEGEHGKQTNDGYEIRPDKKESPSLDD